MNFSKGIIAFTATLMVVGQSYSLTNGPLQPEFMAFEPVDVTDLVNLPTGDFTYVIPIGDVKGPAGIGYPITLSYHAGIMNEQEATWVGLGWSLNVGAINRMVRGLPDDYAGENINVYFNDAGKNGWSFNVGGGWGPISATVGWTEKGFQGITSIGLQYGGSGISWNSVNGPSTQLAMSYGNASVGINLADGDKPSWYGKMSIGSLGFSMNSQGGYGFSSPIGSSQSGSSSLSKDGFRQMSSGYGFSLPLPFGFRFDLSRSEWGWSYTQLSFSKGYGYLYQSRNLEKEVLTYNDALAALMPSTANWQYSTFRENALAKSAVSNGLAHIKNTSDKLEYLRGYAYRKFEGINGRGGLAENNQFNLPSQDIYHVSGQGINGAFKPFTYEPMITSFASEPDYDGLFGKPLADKTIPDDDIFNQGAMKFSPKYCDGLVFKMLNESSMNLIDNLSAEYDYYTKDSYSNIDIGASASANRVYGTRIEPIFGLDGHYTDKLSGFSITDVEGKTYWYTYPLYSLQQASYVNSTNQQPDELMVSCKCSYREEDGPYATTWLLTAITGPDYIRKNENLNAQSIEEMLMPHQGDWGYWVAFRYKYGPQVIKNDGLLAIRQPEVVDGKEQDFVEEKVKYGWRDPFYDSETPIVHKQDPCVEDGKFSSTYGIKEITYLKSIETPSEIAFFRTSERLDGIGLSSDDYPRFGKYPIAKGCVENINTTNDDFVNVEGLIRTCAPIIKRANEVGSLDSYTKIVLPANRYPLSMFQNMELGTRIAQLNFHAHRGANYVSSFSGRTRQENANGYIYVQWDPYGWDPINKSWETSKQTDFNPEIKWMEFPSYVSSGWNNLNFTSITNIAKCFHYEADNSNPTDPKIILYIIAYDIPAGKLREIPVKTAASYMCKYNTWRGWRRHHLYLIDNIAFESGALQFNSRNTNSQYALTPYQKKLDEIAWYSKASFPYLDPFSDPGEEGARQTFPWESVLHYPQSYRRAKFRYNYELAKGTPNSIDLISKSRGGGRLSLKEIRMEAGPEDASVSLPPYLFAYQNKDTPYAGFEKVDKWGFGKPSSSAEGIDPQHTDAALGVNWNLSEIRLPSCGSIGIEYERDKIASSFGTLYKMRTFNECKAKLEIGSNGSASSGDLRVLFADGELPPDLYPDMGDYWDPDINGDYYLEANITSTLNNSVTEMDIEFPAVPAQEPKAGMFFFIEMGHNWNSPVPSKHHLIICTFTIESVIKYNATRFRIGFDRPATLLTFDNDLEKRVKIITVRDLYCDGLRTKSIRIKGYQTEIKTVYSYSDGDVELLPDAATPYMFTAPFTAHRTTDNWYEITRCVEARPFSPNPIENYNTGNTTVIYPRVEVSQINLSGDKLTGITEYDFYTIHDKVNIGGTPKKIISHEFRDVIGSCCNTINAQVKTIYDRSAIVGMLKSVKMKNAAGTKITKEIINEYTFSEDIHNKGGSLFNSLNNTLSSQQPIGLTRERSIRVTKNGTEYPVDGIADVIVSKPFLTKIVRKTDGVTGMTENGLFDARTSAPMATLSKNDNTAMRLDVAIPYAFLLKEAESADTSILKSKNIYKLHGLSFVAAQGTIPSNLKTFIDGSAESIKQASGTLFSKESFLSSANVPYQQSMFWPNEQYAWKGGATFSLLAPGAATNDWLKTMEVNKVDRYTRPLAAKDASLTSHSVIMHPYSNLVIGSIANAGWNECAAFTCDYDDYSGPTDADASYLEDGYFDRQNGWEKGLGNANNIGAEVYLSNEKHFGQKSVYVHNAYGPTKNCKVYAGRKYILSAWAKVTEGTLKMVAEYRTGDASGNLNSPTSFATKVIAAEPTKWQFIRLEVPCETLTGDNWWIRMWIGNDNAIVKAHIDDIRFYPENALTTTHFYDHQLGLPITFIDANDRAVYYKYDEFGRLVEKGAIKDN